MRIPFFGFALAAVGLVFASGVSSARAQGATYKIVAFSDQPSPGGGTFHSFGLPTIGADGTVGFATNYSENEGDRPGVFAGKPGSLRRVISIDDPVPGASEVSFTSFGPVSVSKDGLAAFNAEVYLGEGYVRGIWSEVATGSPVSTDKAQGFSLEAYGDVAFRAGEVFAKALITPDPEGDESFLSSSIGALLRTVDNRLTAVLKEGDKIQGRYVENIISRNDYYDVVGSQLDVNESGQVALKLGIRPGPSPTPTANQAIYAGAPASPDKVAEQGDSAPGAPNFTFKAFSTKPSIAANNFVAFGADLLSEGGVSSAIYSTRSGALAPLVVSGDPVPTAAGVTFGTLHDAVVNSTGDVVFSAEILYPNHGSREGLWVKRLSGPPVLIACDGVFLPTPAGDREVSSVSYAGPGTFNDLHQFVFRASFTDGGEGIYVADTRPGAPVVFVRTPRKPRDFVTADRSVEVEGFVTDDTGVEKVEFTVAREIAASRKGASKASKKKPRKFVVSRPRPAKGASQWSFKVPLSVGLNLISIVATDRLGNTSEPYKIRMLRYVPKDN